jgi:hypothetical protein
MVGVFKLGVLGSFDVSNRVGFKWKRVMGGD